MDKKQLNNGLRNMAGCLTDANNFESVATWNGHRFGNVFAYAATSEKTMEANLADIGKSERKTTYMSDLSIGEWCSGIRGVIDTIQQAVRYMCDDVEYMAELILCVNWKSWEHSARGNTQWAKAYGELYYYLYDLIAQYYEGDSEKSRYLWEYLD